jgi:hypothetical protein
VGTRIPTGIVLVAGIVLLVFWPEKWIISGLLIIVGSVIRIYGLRRGKLKFVPWPLTVIALVMPRPAAHSYLEEVGCSANEVRGRERRRHVWRAIVASPGTLVTVWHGRLRAKLVKMTVWALSRRVRQVQFQIWDVTASHRQYQAALRSLRRSCWLILCATGRGQYPEYAAPARALLVSCRRSAENGGEAELAARIRREVDKLAFVLTTWRPDRA